MPNGKKLALRCKMASLNKMFFNMEFYFVPAEGKCIYLMLIFCVRYHDFECWQKKLVWLNGMHFTNWANLLRGAINQVEKNSTNDMYQHRPSQNVCKEIYPLVVHFKAISVSIRFFFKSKCSQDIQEVDKKKSTLVLNWHTKFDILVHKLN